MARSFSNSAVTVRVEGGEELLRQLQELPKKVGNQILRKALRKGAVPIEEEQQNRVAVDTGLTEKSIIVRMGKRKVKGTQSVVIFPDPKKFEAAGRDFSAPYLEYGTAHMEAKPFVRPSFDAKKDEAMKIIAEEIKGGIEAAKT